MSSGPFETRTLTHAEWLAFRRSHVGGSDAAAVMGLPDAFRTPYQVWAEKTGLAEPEDISGIPRVEWGTRLEGTVVDKVEELHPEVAIVRPVPDRHTVLVPEGRPWAMATLDGIVDDGDRLSVLEVKTAHFPGSKYWGESGTGARGVPPRYLAQVNHYLSVTGWDRAYVAVLIDGWDYREYVVERDEDDVRAVADAVDRFWEDCVRAGVPPEVTATDVGALLAVHAEAEPEYVEGDGAQLELVEEWRDATARERQAKAEAADLATRIKAMVGDAAGIEFPEGRVTWIRNRTRRFDRRLFAKEEPEMYASYCRSAVNQRLSWRDA